MEIVIKLFNQNYPTWFQNITRFDATIWKILGSGHLINLEDFFIRISSENWFHRSHGGWYEDSLDRIYEIQDYVDSL